MTNKSVATSGKRKSLTSDQETEFIFLFDPSEGRFNSGIQVLRSYLSYIYCKFLLKIKCYQISFSKQRNLHTDLGSLWFLQQFKTFLCEENVNLYRKIFTLPIEESRTCSYRKPFISRWNYGLLNFIDRVTQRESVDTINFGQNSRKMENVG